MVDPEKYALVTGASSGIGWNISEELAKSGYSIIAVSNQPVQLQDLKSALEQVYGIRVIIFDTDLSLDGSAIRVFNFCRENKVIVEVLINNAGIFFFSEISKTDLSSMRSMLVLHNVTPALLCRLFGEQMIINGKGYILNVSSITAVMPFPGISLYGPTKAFIRHFTRALRTEMKLDKINVTCLIPGATDTSLYSKENLNVSRLKKFRLMKSPKAVAKAGIRALFRNRAECIPGFLNKISVLLVPLVPRFVIEVIARRTNIIRKRK